MNLFKLTNVSIDHALKTAKNLSEDSSKMQAKLHEVIMKSAIANPTWDFIAMKFYDYSDGYYEFQVRCNGEILGKITREQSRGEYAVGVTNDRIKEKRTRGEAYITTDPAKAVLQIKKTFAPMNVSERLKKARTNAGHVMENLIYSKNEDLRTHDNIVKRKASAWAQGHGFKMFLDYLAETSMGEHDAVIEEVKKRELYKSEYTEMDDIRNGISSGRSVFLVREGSNYIVQKQGEVNIYNDDNLPDEYKTGLGMLKLVGDKTFITSMGCRIDETTFVIKVEEKE